jgi:hypothetical protein
MNVERVLYLVCRVILTVLLILEVGALGMLAVDLAQEHAMYDRAIRQSHEPSPMGDTWVITGTVGGGE